MIKTNSPKAWVLAARPKTLTGASVPVMIALALAWADGGASAFRLVPAVLCMLFALVMQVDANLVNDYFDFKKGVDDEHRLGPKRACAQGWVTLEAMRKAILITTCTACLLGLPLVAYGGWEMVAVGVACVLFCFLYTTHLSYLGLGDLLVLVFFGLVPVCATFYLQRGTVTTEALTASLACGLVIDTLLVVNNYRDRDNDKRTGKTTLVVRIGPKSSEWLFLMLGVVACAMGVCFWLAGRPWAFVLPLGYLALHVFTWRRMVAINTGERLNGILGENARNMFVYGLLTTIGLIL
ncbi:MAG: 1,4-dihydroxy-2-naphthoate octaprenyltransferase [Prevotella sp.]|nr:1,4-dihydroxy-2-naphthoate octaprenyltransferase [Prevotella sp.]